MIYLFCRNWQPCFSRVRIRFVRFDIMLRRHTISFVTQKHVPVLWTIRDEFVGAEPPAVWAVFSTHKEVRRALFFFKIFSKFFFPPGRTRSDSITCVVTGSHALLSEVRLCNLLPCIRPWFPELINICSHITGLCRCFPLRSSFRCRPCS